jgi:hypothetical protein
VGIENYGLPAESVKWHGGNNRGKDYREVAELRSCQRGDADGDVEALASGGAMLTARCSAEIRMRCDCDRESESDHDNDYDVGAWARS